MKVGVARFPGTNCDFDIWNMVEAKKYKPRWLWHQDRFDAGDVDMIVIPGGFSYGDYLRCGALAARSPVMESIREAAGKGKPVLGICNGFQILCESGLLPGVLLRNKEQKFIDTWVDLNVAGRSSHFGKTLKSGQTVRLPIAHGEGNFFAPAEQLKMILNEGLVWLTYEKNPNGSQNDIAGVMNAGRNVFGLMPHPERALFDWMGGADGWSFL